MRPTIFDGDLLKVRKCSPVDLNAGDIVMVERNGSLVAHRFLSLDEQGHLLVRGDALQGADAPDPASALVGIVVRVQHASQRARIRYAVRRLLARFGI